MSESSAVNIQMMNQDVDVSDIKATGNDTYKIATYSSNANISTDNDELLATALSELENENIYKKPVGRSCRKTKDIKTSLSCDAHFKAIDPNPGTRSSQSSSTENILFCDDTSSVAFVPKKQKISSPLPILSDSSDGDVSEVRMDFIEFINKKKDIILSLISDDYNSEAQFRSERVFAVRNLPSLKQFQTNAIRELEFMSDLMGSLVPYQDLIFSEILTKPNSLLALDTDDYDPGYGGYYTLPVNVRASISMAKILDYIIIPELITEFYMELHDISYKEASLKLYANSLPTVHHIDTLMCTALYCREISGIMIQCVLGNLSQQWTHGILNAIDNYLNHSNSIAKSVMEGNV